MKHYLSKQWREVSSYSEKGRRSYLILNVLSLVLFVLGAFTLFSALYLICNCLGSVVSGTPLEALQELVRVFPILLSELGMIYVAAFVHNWSKPKTKEKFQRNAFKNGIICASIGGIVVVYVLVGLLCGLYHGILEGYPTKLFPLDLLFFGLAYVIVGVYLLVLGKKLDFDLPYEDHPNHTLFGILGTIQYMGSEFAFAAIIYSFYVVDWVHGHLFYSIMLELIFLLMVVMIAIYKFVYCPLKQEEKKGFQQKASVVFLIINVIVFILYLVAFSLDVEAPTDAWYGILAIDFTASLNAVTYLYGLMLIVPPVIALISSLKKKKLN